MEQSEKLKVIHPIRISPPFMESEIHYRLQSPPSKFLATRHSLSTSHLIYITTLQLFRLYNTEREEGCE